MVALRDPGHAGQAVGTAACACAHANRLGLVGALMAEGEVQQTGLRAGVGKSGVAGAAGALLQPRPGGEVEQQQA